MVEAEGRPAASVIVPAYRSAATIEATIRSVLAQRRRDLELIVVDDGSPDASAEIAARWTERDRRVRLHHQENAGTSAARAAGAALASGRALAFLDADDLWLPGFLEATLTALEADPGRGLAFADAWLYDDAGGRVAARTALEHYRIVPPTLPAERSSEWVLERLLRLNFLTTCGVLVSRDAYERAGGIDPAVRGVDDWDLWLRIAGASYTAVGLGEPLAVLRKRADSQSADRELMGRGSAAVLEAAIARELPPAAERVAERHLRALRAELDPGSGLLAGARGRIGALRRRLGGRRLRPPGAGSWHPPPPPVARLLDEVGG